MNGLKRLMAALLVILLTPIALLLAIVSLVMAAMSIAHLMSEGSIPVLLMAAVCGLCAWGLFRGIKTAYAETSSATPTIPDETSGSGAPSLSKSWARLVPSLLIAGFLAISAFIGIPKYHQLFLKRAEGAAKGNLGSIRSAISIYYNDMQGQYPSDLAALTVSGKYLLNFPAAWPNDGGDVQYYGPHKANDHDIVTYRSHEEHDTGKYAYIGNPHDPNVGTVWIDCTHTDSKGTLWTSY